MTNELRCVCILFLFALLLVTGCRKESITPAFSIDETSKFWDGNQDAKQRFQLRMALAKTVSSAFASKDFIAWFREKGFVSQDNHFNELLIARHANDIIGNSGKTLIEFLEMYVDKEVQGLFGTHFFELLFKHDPCVAIKMPDIFLEVDWDPEKVRPVVIPQLPYTDNMESIFGQGKWFPVYFNGVAINSVWNPRTYFYVAIKYSEDYILLDPVTLENERGISFYEILPQAQQCNNGMVSDLIALGEAHPEYPNLILVHRLKAFYRWQELCGFQDNYWARYTGCAEECIRTCVPINESVYVIDSFRMNGHVIFHIITNDVHLSDSYTYSWSFWNVFPQVGQFTRFTVPAVPHEWFKSRNISITFLETSKSHPPRINYTVADKTSDHYFPVKMKFKTFVVPEDVTSYSFDYIVYSERMDPFIIAHPTLSEQSELKASQLFSDHLANIFGCDPEHYPPYSNYCKMLLTF